MKGLLFVCVLIFMFAMTGLASATPITLNEVGVNDAAVVDAYFGGGIKQRVSALAGYYQLSINDAKGVNGFCVDPAWAPNVDTAYDLRAIDPASKYAKAAYLFSLSKNFDASAVQIAIWTTVMGSDFIWYNTGLTVNGKSIKTEVNTLLADLNTIPVNFDLTQYSFAASPGTGPSYGQGAQDYIVNTPVPEPGTLFLLGAGLAGLALFRRRAKK